MAQLKDLLVAGPSRFIGDVYADQISAKNAFSDWLPSVTDTYSLGSTNLRWKNAYFKSALFDNLTVDDSLSAGKLSVISGPNDITGTTTVNGELKVKNTITARNIYPETTDTYNLGSSTYRWKLICNKNFVLQRGFTDFNADPTTDGISTWNFREYQNSNTGGPTTSLWWHVLTGNSPDSNYNTQLALGMTGDGVVYRRRQSSWKDWWGLARYPWNTAVGSSSSPVYLTQAGVISEVGTIAIAVGGTNSSSAITVDRMVITKDSSAPKITNASTIYATDTALSINKTSITTGYNFEVNGTSIFDDNITSQKTIYFGGNSSSGKAVLGFSSSYPKYGIWYFDETKDSMTFSANGKADSKTTAELRIYDDTLYTEKIYPLANSTSDSTGRDLGSTSYRWKNLYVRNGYLSNALSVDGNVNVGGQLNPNGGLYWINNDALPEATSLSYFLGIDAFANGGRTKWISAANACTSIVGTPTVTIGAGTASNAPTVSVKIGSKTGTSGQITKATTGLWGVTKLSSTSSTSEEGLAATPKGVWAAIDTVKYQVAQGGNQDDKEYPILFKYNDNTTDETNTVKFANKTNFGITANPSTGTITAKEFKALYKINQILTGTGTAGGDSGSSNTTTRYKPSKWTFDTGAAVTDGDIFTIKLPAAGHSYGVYMSVDNGVNYYPVVANGTGRITTHYPSGTCIQVVFEASGSAASMYPVDGGMSAGTVTGGVFRVINYYDSGNSNDTTVTYARYGYGNFAPITALYRYQILLSHSTDSSKVIPLNTTSNNTGTGKTTITTEAFNPFEYIYYYTTTGTVNANANIGISYLWYAYALIDLRYSFNTGTTLVANKDVYLVAQMQSDGTAKLRNPGATGVNASAQATGENAGPISQILPTTEDGYVYIKFGHAYDTYRTSLTLSHPIYWYKDGAIRPYSYSDSGIYLPLHSNADSATTATNLASAPSLSADGNNIKVTAGGKTSDAFTVPFATNSTNATTAQFVGKGTHTAQITINEFTPAVGTLTLLGNVTNTSMPRNSNANAEMIIKTHPSSSSNHYEARLGFSSNGILYYMPVNTSTWKALAYTSDITTAIQALDVSEIAGAVSKTITSISEIDGKISATYSDISITKSQISDFPTSLTPTSHTHGNITNDGKITTAITVASGDYLIVGDTSDGGKLGKGPAFVSTTAKQFLKDTGAWVQVDWGDLTGKPSTFTPSSHTHGNITNAGELSTATRAVVTDGNKKITVADLTVSSATAETTTATTFVYSVTQNAQGQITVKTRPLPTYNNYSLPLAANGTRGGIQIGYASSGKNYAVQLNSEKAYVNVPWTDTKVNYSLNTTAKAYLMASTTTPTGTAAAVESIGDTGVYLTATAGELSSLRYSWHDTSATPIEKAYTTWNAVDESIDFIFI